MTLGPKSRLCGFASLFKVSTSNLPSSIHPAAYPGTDVSKDPFLNMLVVVPEPMVEGVAAIVAAISVPSGDRTIREKVLVLSHQIGVPPAAPDLSGIGRRR
jgi:hypothetical protein